MNLSEHPILQGGLTHNFFKPSNLVRFRQVDRAESARLSLGARGRGSIDEGCSTGQGHDADMARMVERSGVGMPQAYQGSH